MLGGLLGDRAGVEVGLQVSALGLAGGLVLWWSAGSNPVLVTLFAVVFGLAHGGYVALFPAVAAARYGASGLGRRLGLLYTSAALGGFLGPLFALAPAVGGGSLVGDRAPGVLGAAFGWLALRPAARRRPRAAAGCTPFAPPIRRLRERPSAD